MLSIKKYVKSLLPESGISKEQKEKSEDNRVNGYLIQTQEGLFYNHPNPEMVTKSTFGPEHRHLFLTSDESKSYVFDSLAVVSVIDKREVLNLDLEFAYLIPATYENREVKRKPENPIDIRNLSAGEVLEILRDR